ncbi:MAG: hemin ABC transporter ATP-binding protein [Phycisphaerae bacterium]|nr:hemin ABC transporter ATP-binding protein [Phycisphaerae bacterium]
MTLIVHDVDHEYPSSHALAGVCAEARAGCITSLLGSNASGKTTLLRIVAGLLRPTAGSVTWQGVETGELPAARRAASISFLSQRPRQDVPLTVRQVIQLARVRLEPSPSEADAIIESLELEDLLDRPYPALSVGQQQRVHVARVLYQHQPGGMLVLDEPTAPMDPRHASMTLEAIRARASGGATVIVSMHDIGLASSCADDAWLLREGALVHAGPVEDVLEPANLQDAFGIPYEWVKRNDGSSWLVPG